MPTFSARLPDFLPDDAAAVPFPAASADGAVFGARFGLSSAGAAAFFCATGASSVASPVGAASIVSSSFFFLGIIFLTRFSLLLPYPSRACKREPTFSFHGEYL